MKKKLFILVSLIGILISIFIIGETVQPETFVIPKGFKGRVMIVFGKKTGVPPKFEQWRRLYEIPQNGILVTQCEAPTGFLNRQFYYVDSLNRRFRINCFTNEKDAEKTKEVGVLYSGTSGVYGHSSDSLSIIYNDVIITDYKSLNLFYSSEYKKRFQDALEKAVGYSIQH